MEYSLSGSSVHGILQARILEWISRPSSRGSSWSRDRTWVSYVSCIGRWSCHSGADHCWLQPHISEVAQCFSWAHVHSSASESACACLFFFSWKISLPVQIYLSLRFQIQSLWCPSTFLSLRDLSFSELHDLFLFLLWVFWEVGVLCFASGAWEGFCWDRNSWVIDHLEKVTGTRHLSEYCLHLYTV